MSGLFTAKREDGRAYWRVVYDRVVTMEPGDTITHGELLTLLETDDRRTLYQNVAKADRRLRKSNHRALGNVPGLGYRMLRAEEHVLRAQAHKSRASHQMHTAVSVVKAADLSLMNQQDRDWTMRMAQGMVLLAQVLSQQAQNLARHDELIRDLSVRVSTLETGVSADA